MDLNKKEITDQSEIISFILGLRTDAYGRYYTDICDWDHDQMEECHDHIQWLFPLHEYSNFATIYPVLTNDVHGVIFKNHGGSGFKGIKTNMLLALDRMSRFYGFDTNDVNIYELWCKNGDHNLLRITRIIRSVRLLVGDEEVFDFYNKAMSVGKQMGIYEETLSYWERAWNEPEWDSLR